MSAEHRKRTYEAAVLLNGQPVKEKPELEGDRLTVRVPLTGRDNAIQVKLTDSEKKWALSRTSERVAVRYLRPPRNIQIAKPQVAQAKKSLTDITAQVDSVPKLTAVEVEINGRSIKPSSEIKPAKGDSWTVSESSARHSRRRDQAASRATGWGRR